MSKAKRTKYSLANVCGVSNWNFQFVIMNYPMSVGLNLGKVDCSVKNIQENDNNEQCDFKLFTTKICLFNDKLDIRTVKVKV